MLIEQKLTLSEQPNKLILINEGLFMRCYNQSAFITVGLLGMPFKLTVCRVKKLDNQFVIYCGFPKSKLNDYFIKPKLQDFGFTVTGNFNLTYYEAWLKQKIKAAERCNNTARARQCGRQTTMIIY